MGGKVRIASQRRNNNLCATVYTKAGFTIVWHVPCGEPVEDHNILKGLSSSCYTFCGTHRAQISTISSLG
jgi:hypothetical protein